MTTPEPPAAVVAGPLPAQLPFPRFAAAAASSSPPPPCRCSSRPSPPSPLPPPPAATASPTVTRSSRAPTLTVMASTAAQQAAGPSPGTGGDADTSAAPEVVAEVEDKMDLLWEDFNEELLVARGGRRWSSSGSSDAESSSASRGCAPVLRPSSRAGAAVRHCRRRAGTWVLLMRIFRRLFVIEKTTAVSRRKLHAAAATATTTRAS